MSGRYIPLGVRAANASLRQIDPSLEESAQILGASWATTMREITLPLIRPGLFAGWLLVFVPVIQELSRLDPAVQLELDHARGRGLQSLRDRLYRAGGGARHHQHGDHRRRDLARLQARRRRHRGAARAGSDGVVMAGITIKGLSKHFGARDADVAAVSRSRSRHQGQPVRHAARAERLRQDHDAAADRRLHRARRRHHPRRRAPRLLARRASCRRMRAAWAWCSRTTRCGRTRPCSRTSCSASRSARCRPPRRGARSRRRWRSSTSPASSSATRTSCRAASSSASRSRAAWWSSRRSCCSTSRSPTSTPSCASACAPS